MILVVNGIFIRYPKKNDGISRYSFSVINSIISRITKSDKVYILVDRLFKYQYLKSKFKNKNIYIVLIPIPTFILFGRKIWTLFIIEFFSTIVGADVLWGPDGIISNFNKRVRKFVTLHDVNYMVFPENNKVNHVKFFNEWLNESLSNSYKIFTVSEFSKREIIKYYKMDPGKIVVAYNGVKLSEINNQQHLIYKNKYGHKKYIYTVGNLEPRKNLSNILFAFSELLKKIPDLYLIVTGSVSWKSENIHKIIENNQLKSKIIFSGYIDDSELVYLYSNCKLFIYVPQYEGFGFPIIEAITCGAKVLASDIPVFHEIANDYCHFVDPDNINSIVEGIIVSIDGERKYNDEMKKYIINKFSWEASGIIHYNTMFEKP